MIFHFWRKDHFGGIAIIMIAKIVLSLTRCFTRFDYVDQFMNGHGEGDAINNIGFKICAIIFQCYGRIMERNHITTNARSLRYFMWISYTPYNDTLNWLVHSKVRSLVKHKRDSSFTVDYYISSPAFHDFLGANENY